jgi:hypothetical protein
MTGAAEDGGEKQGTDDAFGAPTTTFHISVPADGDVPSFLALVGSPFRWRASLAADENGKCDEQRRGPRVAGHHDVYVLRALACAVSAS